MTTAPLFDLSPAALAEREAAWHQMSRAEKRVTLAQDVIALITAKLVVPKTRDLLQIPVAQAEAQISSVGGSNGDLRSYLAETLPQHSVYWASPNPVGYSPCTACALGSLVVALCLREDQMKITDAYHHNMQSNIKRRLASVFDADEVEALEMAFENGDGLYRAFDPDDDDPDEGAEGDRSSLPYFDQVVAMRFGQGHSYPRERLLAMMENIVSYGTFRP